MLPPENSLSRRDLLKLAGFTVAGFSLGDRLITPATAAEEAVPATASLPPSNHFPRMMQEYFVGRVREVERLANERRAALRTKADAERYVRDVRDKIQQCFAPWPEKTPLNARVTGVIERDTYRVE